MGLEAATGFMAGNEQLLANNVANATEWISLTGAANAAEAANSIYFDALPSPADGKNDYTSEEWQAILPNCLIGTVQNSGLEIGEEAVGYIQPSGYILCTFELKIPDSIVKTSGKWESRRIEYGIRWAKNRASALLSGEGENVGIFDNSGNAGFLHITRMATPFYAMMSDQQSADLGFDVARIEFRFGWGFS